MIYPGREVSINQCFKRKLDFLPKLLSMGGCKTMLSNFLGENTLASFQSNFDKEMSASRSIYYYQAKSLPYYKREKKYIQPKKSLGIVFHKVI